MASVTTIAKTITSIATAIIALVTVIEHLFRVRKLTKKEMENASKSTETSARRKN